MDIWNCNAPCEQVPLAASRPPDSTIITKNQSAAPFPVLSAVARCPASDSAARSRRTTWPTVPLAWKIPLNHSGSMLLVQNIGQAASCSARSLLQTKQRPLSPQTFAVDDTAFLSDLDYVARRWPRPIPLQFFHVALRGQWNRSGLNQALHRHVVGVFTVAGTRIERYINLISSADSADSARQFSVHRPEITRRSLPDCSTHWTTRLSSKAFRLMRSMGLC